MKQHLLALTLFSAAATGLTAAGLDPAAMMPNEWTEFRYERLAVLKADPDLLAADKQLDLELKAQAGKVEAAMTKADPSVAPILAKVSALLRSNWGARPAESESVSVADWQKLRAARAAALENDPALAAANKALLEKKGALDAKIDAALAQADPNLAPLIQKFKERASD